MFLFIVFFLRRGNGQTVKMEFIGMIRRKKEEIEIRGVSYKRLFNIGRQRDKDFNCNNFRSKWWQSL